MKALVFDGKLSLRDVPMVEPDTGEALIKVRTAGICNTDVEITRGYMDFQGILGHEFVGTVVSSPDASLTGKRVVGEINAGCGECDFCKKGLVRHCPHRTVLGILRRNGAIAEFLVLPLANLVEVPDAISDEKAVFVEPLAAAVEILEQVKIDPYHSVMIIGDGKLGLLISMVLRLIGCDLLLVGKHKEKMELFARIGGTTISMDDLSKSEDKFDVIIEASGNPSGWELATKYVKPRGTIVLKSTYHEKLNYNPALLVVNEITIVGSRCGQFAPALRLMELGLVDPTPLISAVYDLSNAERAFEHAQQRNVLKVLLKNPI